MAHDLTIHDALTLAESYFGLAATAIAQYKGTGKPAYCALLEATFARIETDLYAALDIGGTLCGEKDAAEQMA